MDSPIYHLGSKSNMTSLDTVNFHALSEHCSALFVPLFLCACLHLTFRGEEKGWTSGQRKLAYLLLYFSSSERVSLYNPVCSETLCVDLAILELTEICLPLILECWD